MITVINGTNRAGNITQVFTKYYTQVLQDMGVEHMYFSLEDLPSNIFTPTNYDMRSPEWMLVEATYLIPSDKCMIVFPEYNGTFPGILKTMIDYSDIKKSWWYKKIALAGVSDGRAGGLRGIDQMTTFLHYLKANVYPGYLPISSLGTLLNADKTEIISEQTKGAIRKQLEGFVSF